MKHTRLYRWTGASGKWKIPRHEWSTCYRIAHGWKIWVWICHQGTWELMKQKEPRSIFIIFLNFILFPSHFFLFLSFSFYLYSSFFLTFFLLIIFFSFYIFSFASQNFLQYNTYIAFVRDDSCPMLERCSSSSIKERGNDC
jgi:hypothetical protein